MADDPYEIRILNFQQLGERVADWATGEKPRPARIKDLIALLDVAFDDGGLRNVMALGAGFHEADKQDENISYLRATPSESISVLLPHPEDLAKDPPTEDEYELPDFYNRVYNSEPNIVNSKNFRSERIADYAMRKCV
ncbi:hypothetical protein [uncultured Tateyamaria sp.]|uniref:hypothetical protein n=1 Tax=Tateyamaria sp. 1078 TaxID=3417464 RepID=UPI0026213C81|nr:hypothetical protein [uncultured Tateyamaria sp.]